MSRPAARRRAALAWTVAAAFTLLGIAWFVVHPPDSSVTMDDGAYALAVAQRHEGRWDLPYPAAEADPEGAAYPYPNAQRGEDGYYPYVRQPAWVLALHAGDLLGGPRGMRLVVIAAAAGVVAATAALARAVAEPAAAVVASVLVALSPLAFNALQLWAHAAGTLGVALLLIGASRLMDRGVRAGDLALSCAGAVLASLARADAALFALAAGVVVVAVGARPRRWSLCASGALICSVTAAGQLGSAAVAGSITGASGAGAAADARGSGGLPDRLHAAVGTALSSASPPVGYALALGALLAVGVAVASWRRGDGRAAVVLLVLAAVAWAVRAVVAHDELATGLLGAWPVALLAALDPWSAWSAPRRRLLAVALVGTTFVLLMQYDEGGGANWGGRFLTPALPILAVLAAAPLVRAARDGQLGGRRLVRAALAVAALAATASLVVDSHYRTQTEERIEEVAAVAEGGWVVTSSRALPNLAWRTAGDIRWLRVPAESDGGAVRLRRILDDLGLRRVVAYRAERGAVDVLRGRGGAGGAPIDVRVEP